MENETAAQEPTQEAGEGAQNQSSSSATQNPVSSSSSSSSVQPESVTVGVSRDELERLLAQYAGSAADAAASSVGTQVSEHMAAGGTVALVDEQYTTLRSLDGAQLHGLVFAIGLLSLILGAIVAVGMTLHMRGSRNG